MHHAGLILGFSVAISSITAVFSVCVSETRFSSDQAADDFSWYSLAFYNGSLSDCDCGAKYTCVRKCCDQNYFINSNGSCAFGNDFSVPIFEYGNVIVEGRVNSRFISGISACHLNDDEFYLADIKEVYVQKDGRLWLPAINTYFEHDHYCLEYDEDEGQVAFLCILDYDIQGLEISERLTVIGMIISLPFLLITFIVYAILPLRNLHGQSLMCYVFALFSTYLLYVIIHMYPDSEMLNAIVCRSLAMLFYFFFVSSFFWMNVMSVDIWLTFSGSRGFPRSRRKTERRRFLIYSAYAWGSPLALVVLVLTISSSVKPNRWYNPGVTDQQCWLNDGIPMFLYLYLPMALLIIANIVLFAITACKIRQVQQDTAMLRQGDNKTSKSEDDKVRFGVYLKLFLAMGVNWSMEVISWAIDWQVEHVPPAVWYVTEFCNAAFGVFIFFIFVFKKKIWRLLKKRYYTMRGKPHLELAQTESTTTSSGNK